MRKTSSGQAMPLADRLQQSIQCVYVAHGKLAESMMDAPGDLQALTVDPDDDEGPWREACDMCAQARVEVTTVKETLDQIAALLSGKAWDADTLDGVADAMRQAGYAIEECEA